VKETSVAKIAITTGALILVGARVLWPDLKIDAVTLGLALVAVLPWLSSVIKSAELPGGWKVEFQEIRSAGEKVTSGAPEPEAKVRPLPSYLEIAPRDPNLALAGLRIEIERRLRGLAEKHRIQSDLPLRRLLNELQRRGVLAHPSVSGLQELITAGNQAAHGAPVDPRAAEWAIDYGPGVLTVLDELIERPEVALQL
jgi:hypothetical protein